MSRLSTPLPTGTIDSHMHIIPSNLEKYPLDPSAEYTPKPHTVHDAMRYYASTSGLALTRPRMVLTQVSTFGTDNSSLLDGLAEINRSEDADEAETAIAGSYRGQSKNTHTVLARGVVAIDADRISIPELETLWSRGARGVRINLVSVSRSVTEDELRHLLQTTIDRLVQTGVSTNCNSQTKWVIELYLPFTLVEILYRVIPNLTNSHRIRLCLDHFAGLKLDSSARINNAYSTDTSNDPSPQASTNSTPVMDTPAFSALLSLLTSTNPGHPETYLKISAPYRIDTSYPSTPTHALHRLEPIAITLLRKASHRLVWASDWPHTRFENVDIVPFVEACYRWCEIAAESPDSGTSTALDVTERDPSLDLNDHGHAQSKGLSGRNSEELKRRLFTTNAEKLWDMDVSDLTSGR